MEQGVTGRMVQDDSGDTETRVEQDNSGRGQQNQAQAAPARRGRGVRR